MERDYEALYEQAQSPTRKKEKGDYLIGLILKQAMLCVLVFGLLFALRSYQPGILAQLRETYAAQKVITLADIQAFAKEVKSKLEKDGKGGRDETLAAAKKNASFAPVVVTKPAVAPLHGKITSPYGIRTDPITGKKSSFHTGLDIAAKEGDPIGAAYYGKVQFAGEMDSYGNCVILEHSDGLLTLYAHCSKLLVAKGTTVREGETIALVGHTGAATGPHLHFELRVGGKRYSPLWILNKVGANAV